MLSESDKSKIPYSMDSPEVPMN